MAKKRKKPTKTPPRTVRTSSVARKFSATAAPRVWRAIRLRCRGYRPVEIYPMIAREFSVSERQANDDVTAANKLIAEGLQNVLEHEATMGLEFLTEVKREAIESGSLGDAVRAQQEINKMLGNHAATRVEHSGTVGVAPDLSGLPPEKRKLLLELVEGDEG